MKHLFLLVFISFQLVATAQNIGRELRANNQIGKVLMSDVLGDWYLVDSMDTTDFKISFTNVNNSFVEIDGIKHGVGNYIFNIVKDSIWVNGTAANWPPYYCTLKLTDDNHLEIDFYNHFSVGTTKMIFRRRGKK